MDTVHASAPMNMDTGKNALTRKEIRRQKLMEYLATKAKLPSIKANVGKDEMVKNDRSVLKISKDKENIPAHNKDTKVKTLVQPTPCVKRPLGLNNKENINCSNLAGKQNSKNISTINKEAKAHKLPVFTRTYTFVTSKSTLNAASQKPITRQSAVMASSKTHDIKVANNRTSLYTNAASASMNNTVNSRMIHGPIIKTRTGLVPAVIQPRNTKPNISTTANGTKTISNKVQSSSSSYRPVSQVSNRKTISTVTLKPASVRTVAMTERVGNKTQNKCVRPSLSKHLEPSLNKKMSSGLQSSSRFTSKSHNPDTKAGTTKTNVLISRPRFLAEVNKNKPCQGKIHPNSMPANSNNFKVNKVVTVSNQGSKSKISKGAENKKAATATKPGQVQVPPKGNKKPSVSQTAPQPSRTLSLTNRTTDTKTPQVRAPLQTAQMTLTAAQERIRKLQEWREAKGISYKRPPMLSKTQARRTIAVPQPFWSSMKEEDEAHSLINAVDRSLADCIKLLGEGCPTHQVKEVLSRLPAVSQKFAKYWICQARLMEQDGNLDVLPMFEKAVGLVLEPVDELRTVVFEILKKRDENQENNKEDQPTADTTETSPETLDNPIMTPKPSRALICAEKGDSSVVKYKITATPGGPPSQQGETTVVNGQEVRFFTPVRRSVRIERASLRYPVSLQDHDLCVASYNDLIAAEEKENSDKQSDCEAPSTVNDTPLYIYRENEALKDKVFVEYVCNDA